MADEQNDDSYDPASDDILTEGEIVENRFFVLEKMQSGSFGQVFLAVDKKKDDLEVALKIEKPRPEGMKSFCAYEVNVLKRCHGLKHIPEMYAFNTKQPKPYIALQLLSVNLSELRRSCPSKVVPRFSLSTTVRIGTQAFEGIRELHGVGVVHRDIKPANFMLGSTETTKRCVYLVDFGLSRIFRKSTGELIPPRTLPGFVGSTRYATPNAHDGRDLGRGDDLLSFLYVLIEMRLGRLPWKSIGTRSVVGVMKRTIKIDKLCNGLPAAMVEMGQLIERLKYSDEPNYEKIDSLLRSIVDENGFNMDDPFDWDERFVQVIHEDERPISPSSNETQ